MCLQQFYQNSALSIKTAKKIKIVAEAKLGICIYEDWGERKGDRERVRQRGNMTLSVQFPGASKREGARGTRGSAMEALKNVHVLEGSKKVQAKDSEAWSIEKETKMKKETMIHMEKCDFPSKFRLE